MRAKAPIAAAPSFAAQYIPLKLLETHSLEFLPQLHMIDNVLFILKIRHIFLLGNIEYRLSRINDLGIIIIRQHLFHDFKRRAHIQERRLAGVTRLNCLNSATVIVHTLTADCGIANDFLSCIAIVLGSRSNARQINGSFR